MWWSVWTELTHCPRTYVDCLTTMTQFLHRTGAWTFAIFAFLSLPYTSTCRYSKDDAVRSNKIHFLEVVEQASTYLFLFMSNNVPPMFQTCTNCQMGALRLFINNRSSIFLPTQSWTRLFTCLSSRQRLKSVGGFDWDTETDLWNIMISWRDRSDNINTAGTWFWLISLIKALKSVKVWTVSV